MEKQKASHIYKPEEGAPRCGATQHDNESEKSMSGEGGGGKRENAQNAEREREAGLQQSQKVAATSYIAHTHVPHPPHTHGHTSAKTEAPPAKVEGGESGRHL